MPPHVDNHWPSDRKRLGRQGVKTVSLNIFKLLMLTATKTHLRLGGRKVCSRFRSHLWVEMVVPQSQFRNFVENYSRHICRQTNPILLVSNQVVN